MRNHRAPIASEGFTYIGLLALIAWVAAILNFTLLSILFAMLAVLCVFFFRDPERDIQSDADSVVSPADGTIITVDEAYERDFLNAPVKRVSISLALYDCHINRMPVEGIVTGAKYTPGSFNIANMPAWLYPDSMKKASDENERRSTLIETPGGQEFVVYQMTGFLARRIVSYAELGMEFKKGDRYGIIKFGSRVDLYMPEGCVVEVRAGDKVLAGETVIAWL
jgi:phosphatidylserine decarboxylase